MPSTTPRSRASSRATRCCASRERAAGRGRLHRTELARSSGRAKRGVVLRVGRAPPDRLGSARPTGGRCGATPSPHSAPQTSLPRMSHQGSWRARANGRRFWPARGRSRIPPACRQAGRRFRPERACLPQAGRPCLAARVAGATGSYLGRGGPGDAACRQAGQLHGRSRSVVRNAGYTRPQAIQWRSLTCSTERWPRPAWASCRSTSATR